MNPNRIIRVLLKEWTDLLRDRRTVISMLFVPLVLMPALMQTVTRVAKTTVDKAKSSVPAIQIVGGEDSPALQTRLKSETTFKVLASTPDWKERLSDKKIQAVVEIPAGFDAAVEAGQRVGVTLYDYEGEMRSGMAVSKLQDFFRKLGAESLQRRLSQAGLPPDFARPIGLKVENAARTERVAGNRIGGLVPYFILILALLGAMHPAFDITSGEKERGTLEALLCAPLSRTEIVLGKFLAVLACSLASIGTACIALVVSFSWLKFPGADPSAIGLSQVSAWGAVAVVFLVIPVATLLSAALVALGTWAKSTREAVSYASPLMALIIVPAVIGMMPGIDLNLKLAFVPVLNLSLACRELLSGIWHWQCLAIVFGSTCAYAMAAIASAVRLFNTERVLLRV